MQSQPALPSTQFSPDHSQSRSHRLWAILILFSGFALRLFHLGAESLWYDETVSVYLAGQSIAELISHTARDIHPPAYYLLLHLWRLFSQPSVAFGLEFLYGWFSLFFSVLVIALTYAVAKRIVGERAALWALAFATFQPAQIWFAQEVRMYALGAFALMLTLWAVSPLLSDRPSAPIDESGPQYNKALYVLGALCGLYTLYYFLFWLVVVNFCILVRIWTRSQMVRAWLLLQVLILIGWLPWLPTFYRQAIDPPVPPWRLPWQSFTDILSATGEAIAAYWVGHIVLPTGVWLTALAIVLMAIAFFVYAKYLGRQIRILWLILCFGPTLLLLLVSVIGPPIYFVRYVATYAPLIAILIGAVLAGIPRVASAVIATVFALVSASALFQLWTSPLYAADDHRNAVATVANEWRPGDSILVNAGWVYTALSIYWPTELPTPRAVRPPAIADIVRLDSSLSASSPLTTTNPILYRSGSVNGDANLGWSLPESDFFGVSQEDTTQALTELAASYARFWHYRLYDTVNDPTGVIRQWLESNTTPELSLPVAGRDFLRLERYHTDKMSAPRGVASDIYFPDIRVTLLSSNYPTTTHAGEMMFVSLNWDTASLSPGDTIPAISLRLYDVQGQMLLQEDTQLVVNSNNVSNQVLALPIPADTIPAQYRLAVLIYSPETLLPYSAISTEGSMIESPITLGEINTQVPQIIPHTGSPVATFDYINLLKVDLPTASVAPGQTFSTAWTWQPEPSDYRDQYVAYLELVGTESNPAPLAHFNLGGDSYLSSTWPANYPLRQQAILTLPEDIPPAHYQLRLSIVRAADSEIIPARLPRRFGSQPYISVGEIEVVKGVQE